MPSFKIENFCSEHNLEFKKYYNYLNNPFYLNILLNTIQYLKYDIIKKKVYNMIIKNHDYILDKLNKIDTIISFYKKNNLINKSHIGKFFTFYEIEKKNVDINNYHDLFELFYKLIFYENCISVLKECFYIFSDYRSCIYFMTPSINFEKTTKSIINDVVKNFKDNLNTLTQIISKIYIGDKNPWGNPQYSTAYGIFETLLILDKYYKEPLAKIGIEFIIEKKNNEKNIVKELRNIINKEYINNVSSGIVTLKKMGYNLWTVIPFVFNIIYKEYQLKNIKESEVFGYQNIYYQKKNNEIGIMCYILLKNNYITNTNIFNNFFIENKVYESKS